MKNNLINTIKTYYASGFKCFPLKVTLNPNTKMLDFLFDASKKTYGNAKVTVRVVTQVILRESEIKSLSNIFSSDSPKTATALRDYEYIQNLFEKVWI